MHINVSAIGGLQAMFWSEKSTCWFLACNYGAIYSFRARSVRWLTKVISVDVTWMFFIILIFSVDDISFYQSLGVTLHLL